jgi:hypothetical protein
MSPSNSKGPSKNGVIAKTTLLALALLLAPPVMAADLAQYFHFDGQLTSDSTGLPMTGPVNLTFQVYDPSGTCLLYEESQSAVTLESDGSFAVKIGPGSSGTRNSSADGGLTWKSIFQNSSVLRNPTSNCSSGYTPSAGDARKLRVTVNGSALTPDFALAPAPLATVAESVQGKVPTDFVQANATKNVTQTKVEEFFDVLTNGSSQGGVKWNGTAFVTYDPTSGASLATNSVTASAIASLPWTKLTSVPAGLTEIGGLSCVDGKILKRSGGAWTCADETGAGSAITSFNGLTSAAQTFVVGTSGTAPAISSSGAIHTLNIPMASSAGVTAGLISKADYDTFNAKLGAGGVIAVSGGGTGATSLGAGNLLVGNGSGAVTSLAAGSAGNIVWATGVSSWTSGSPDSAGIVDKSSVQTIAGAKAFMTNITMNAQNAVRFADSDSSNFVSLRAPATVSTDVVFTLPGIAGAVGQILATDGAGGLYWTTPGGGSWTVSGPNAYRAGGNVGIGTTAPAYPLHVFGSGGAMFDMGVNQSVTMNGTYGTLEVHGQTGKDTAFLTTYGTSPSVVDVPLTLASVGNSGSPMTGNGTGVLFKGYLSGYQDMAMISSQWTDTNLATRRAALSFSMVENGSFNEVMRLSGVGHVMNKGPAATVATCGTGASISGNDTRGRVTTGTGTVTSCAVIFNTSWQNIPFCTVTWQSTGTVPTATMAVNPGFTTFTVYFNTSSPSQTFVYHCME